jgi:hypothetical protein
VLNRGRAERLARQAARRRADGSRGVTARRAWERLVRAGDGGDQAAAGAVWDLWLEDLDPRCGDGRRASAARRAWEWLAWARDRDDQPAPRVVWDLWLADLDGERWDALARWLGPAGPAAAAFEAAVDPGREPWMRAKIGAFCAHRGLAPGGEVARALFFVMTGQHGQHLAADPDGSGLMSAYRGAGAATRAALRDALTSAGAGDLDLVVEGAVSDPAVRDALIGEAARAGHPVRQIARGRILAEAHDQALVDAVCEAAVAGAGAPELAEFCAVHGLAPADPVRRAVFFLLTGQDGQYRAADPDGSLLALGYQAAKETVRGRLRAAMARAGDLDLVRVVAPRVPGGRLGMLDEDELSYLAGQLAGRRDWARLWQVAQDLPLADAAAVMPSFGDGWRPADDRGQVLFARLARADPAEIARAGKALLRYRTSPKPVEGSPICCSFSPDGRRLAVAGRRLAVAGRVGPGPGAIQVFALPGATLAEWYETTFDPERLLHLDEVILASGTERSTGSSVVTSFAGGRAEVLFRSLWDLSLERHPRGFAALLRPPGGAGAGWRLLICAPGGQVIEEVSPTGLGVPDHGRLHFCAADPGSGRLVLRAGEDLWVLGGDPVRVLAHATVGFWISGASFAGPDWVVTHGHKVLYGECVELWHLAGGTLRLQASAYKASDPVPIPQHGKIAVRSGRALKLLDAETLAPGAELPAFEGEGMRPLPGSSDGLYLGYMAVNSYCNGVNLAHVIDVASATAQWSWSVRPLNAMTPADLAAATDPAAARLADPAARPFLELLRDVLEHRFHAEVGISRAMPSVGDDEISLQARHVPRCPG